MNSNDRRTGFFFPSHKRDLNTETDFVAEVHQRFPSKQKSVVIILMDQSEHSILMVQPAKVDWTECPMTLPQGRLTMRSNRPSEDASLILRMKAGVRLQPAQLYYIGYGFSTNHKNNKADGKILHVVGGMVGDAMPMASTDYASLVAWVPIPGLDGYLQQVLSPRKLQIIQQAVMHAPEKSSTFKARALQEELFKPASASV